MTTYGFPWPEMLECHKFPLDNDMCISSMDPSDGGSSGSGNGNSGGSGNMRHSGGGNGGRKNSQVVRPDSKGKNLKKNLFIAL